MPPREKPVSSSLPRLLATIQNRLRKCHKDKDLNKVGDGDPTNCTPTTENNRLSSDCELKNCSLVRAFVCRNPEKKLFYIYCFLQLELHSFRHIKPNKPGVCNLTHSFVVIL